MPQPLQHSSGAPDVLPSPRQLYAADLFAWSGLGLYALFLVSCLTNLLPPRLPDPAWLQTVISTLISNAMFPVIGTCLLVLAEFMVPGDPPGRFWLNLFRRWAWIPLVGYLLLIPLQGYTSLELERLADQPIKREIRGLRDAIASVRTSRTLEELGPVLAKLPGSPRIPEGFSVPFQSFRSQILETLTANQARLTELQSRQASNRIIPRLNRFLHTTFSSLILASVFAAASQRGDTRLSLLRHWLLRGMRRREYQQASRPQVKQDREYLQAIHSKDSDPR